MQYPTIYFRLQRALPTFGRSLVSAVIAASSLDVGRYHGTGYFLAGRLTFSWLSRMLWAFSRDGGVPLFRVWGAINGHLHTPLNATWAMTALAFLLGLPILFSTTAFLAIGSIMCVALYFSCESPFFLPTCRLVQCS